MSLLGICVSLGAAATLPVHVLRCSCADHAVPLTPELLEALLQSVFILLTLSLALRQQAAEPLHSYTGWSMKRLTHCLLSTAIAVLALTMVPHKEFQSLLQCKKLMSLNNKNIKEKSSD